MGAPARTNPPRRPQGVSAIRLRRGIEGGLTLTVGLPTLPRHGLPTPSLGLTDGPMLALLRGCGYPLEKAVLAWIGQFVLRSE
jgi:hypothetical protein